MASISLRMSLTDFLMADLISEPSLNFIYKRRGIQYFLLAIHFMNYKSVCISLHKVHHSKLDRLTFRTDLECNIIIQCFHVVLHL